MNAVDLTIVVSVVNLDLAVYVSIEGIERKMGVL